MKLFWIMVLALLGVGASYASGFRLHPSNLPYYLEMSDGKGQRQNIILKDGRTLTATLVGETVNQVKVDMDGAGVVFSRSEIERMVPIKSDGLFEKLKKNYEKNYKLHPLWTQRKEDSFQQSFDDFVMEPSKIADQIRKDHPEITGQGNMQAMTSQVRDAQVLARANQAAMMKQMEEG